VAYRVLIQGTWDTTASWPYPRALLLTQKSRCFLWVCDRMPDSAQPHTHAQLPVARSGHSGGAGLARRPYGLWVWLQRPLVERAQGA
jgi:hypothetical protein